MCAGASISEPCPLAHLDLLPTPAVDATQYVTQYSVISTNNSLYVVKGRVPVIDKPGVLRGLIE